MSDESLGGRSNYPREECPNHVLQIEGSELAFRCDWNIGVLNVGITGRYYASVKMIHDATVFVVVFH